MKTYLADSRARIIGTSDSWTVASRGDSTAPIVAVNLEIQGDDSAGWHLIKSPKGFFTADDWFLTIEEAQSVALEDFEVAPDSWVASSA